MEESSECNPQDGTYVLIVLLWRAVFPVGSVETARCKLERGEREEQPMSRVEISESNESADANGLVICVKHTATLVAA